VSRYDHPTQHAQPGVLPQADTGQTPVQSGKTPDSAKKGSGRRMRHHNNDSKISAPKATLNIAELANADGSRRDYKAT